MQRQLPERAITGVKVKEGPRVQAHAWVIGLERVKKRATSPSAEQSAAKRARAASGSAVPRAGRPRSRERTIYNISLADVAGGPQTTAVASSVGDEGHTMRVVFDRKNSMATNCAYAAQGGVRWLFDTADWSDPSRGRICAAPHGIVIPSRMVQCCGLLLVSRREPREGGHGPC